MRITKLLSGSFEAARLSLTCEVKTDPFLPVHVRTRVFLVRSAGFFDEVVALLLLRIGGR